MMTNIQNDDIHNNDDDIHNNTKNKKKNKKKKNPLAAARGKKDIDKIWHSKSGDGYVLFVEYYGNQPYGVVCSKSNSNSNSNSSSNAEKDHHDTNSNTNRQQGGGVGGGNSSGSKGGTGTVGMSRASKKRRKKRKRLGGGEYGEFGDGGNNNDTTTTTSDNATVATTTSSNTTKPAENYDDNKLVQAAMMGQSQSHNNMYYEFLTYLSKPLPLSFRIRNSLSDNQKDLIRTELQQYNEQYNSLIMSVPFGDKNIYQAKTNTTSSQSQSHQTVLTKNNLQHLSPLLKQFLNKCTSNGTIARQEIGSMLPVFMLHKLGYLSKGSRVLDLCASPGSKTLQVAELLIIVGNKKGEGRGGEGGRVRANDVNMSRLQALKDAVKRSGISSSSLDKIIKYTNVDATMYKVPISETKKYDVIICDVPCSGDGTCRKDPHIIPNWTPNIANALHKLQLQILQRALKCVRVNGIVSYSTCSLNPIEDEAVVAAALLATAAATTANVNNSKKKKNGQSSHHPKFRIVPIPPIDGLILRRGVTDWRVADYTYGKQQQRQGAVVDSSTGSSNVGCDYGNDDGDDQERPRLRWQASFADATKCGMEHASQGMWPPQPSQSSPSSGLLRLDRCSRLWPQDQNTGGFFVTFIQRIS